MIANHNWPTQPLCYPEEPVFRASSISKSPDRTQTSQTSVELNRYAGKAGREATFSSKQAINHPRFQRLQNEQVHQSTQENKPRNHTRRFSTIHTIHLIHTVDASHQESFLLSPSTYSINNDSMRQDTVRYGTLPSQNATVDFDADEATVDGLKTSAGR
ncbi:hypothetical protein VTK26DRAFT_4994 [Humicola hyalothermophila]